MTRRNLRGLLPALLIAGATTGTASGQQAFVNCPTEIRRALVAADEACRLRSSLQTAFTESVTREPPTRRRPCAGIRNSVGERP